MIDEQKLYQPQFLGGRAGFIFGNIFLFFFYKYLTFFYYVYYYWNFYRVTYFGRKIIENMDESKFEFHRIHNYNCDRPKPTWDESSRPLYWRIYTYTCNYCGYVHILRTYIINKTWIIHANLTEVILRTHAHIRPCDTMCSADNYSISHSFYSPDWQYAFSQLHLT